MEQSSIQRDVHRLFERMHDAIDRPAMNRDQLRDLTDEICALTMVWIDPCVPLNKVFLRNRGMSPKQMAIYQFLLRHKGFFISRQTITDAVWDGEVKQKNFDVQMFQLRKSLVRARLPYRIETRQSVGSRIVDYVSRAAIEEVPAYEQYQF